MVLWNAYKYNIYYVRYADKIDIGNEVLVHENNGLTPKQVTKVSRIIMKGNS